MRTWKNYETNEMRGRALRFLMTRELQRAQRPLTVAELVDRLHGYGFTIIGRASKTVSDSLRWEIASGRVTKVGRGVYRFGSAPKTTLRRIRLMAEYCQDWIVALTRSGSTNSNPATESNVPKPWDNYNWLWQI